MRVKTLQPYALESDPLDSDCAIAQCPDIDPAKNTKPDFCPVGNPVNQATGNKFQIETDYIGTGTFPLKLARFYDSQANATSRFGANWEVFGKITTLSSGLVLVTRPDHRQYYYTLKNGQWVPDADVSEKLSPRASDSADWLLTLPDGTVERYSAAGTILSYRHLSGLTHTVANAASNHVTITDSFGHVLTLDFDATSKRLTKLTDPSGGVCTYAYDANNNLKSVTYPDGKVRTYLYENATFKNALTGIVDESGSRFATYAYDSQGRATLSQHAAGADKYTISYMIDSGGNPVSSVVTDPLGTARTYNFQVVLGVVKNTGLTEPCASCGSTASAQTYDANGNVASRTDFNGVKIIYTYDLARNLEVSRTEAAGTAQARTITTQWHPTYRLPVQIAEPGRTATYTYDANGNQLSKTVTDTASGAARTWSWTYNQYGQVLTATDPRGNVTTHTYDAQGNLASTTNPLGHTTRYTSYDAHGRPLSIADPNGVVTTLTYDPRGRLVSRNVGGETTTYTYDGVGQLIKATLPDGSHLAYTYDAAHRLVALTDNLGNKIQYTLDAMGNRVKEDTFDPSGSLAQTHRRVFDALNRLSQDIGAQGQATAYQYDANGNRTTTTDPLNHATANVYDALNRLTQTTDLAGGITRYDYDPLDHLTSVTDPKGLTTTYSYNGLNDLLSTQSPDTGLTANTYDAAGNLLTRTDAKGQTTRYTYDAGNRITGISYSDGTQVSFTYDQGANGIGRLSRITDATGTTAYTYDPHGRVLTETRTVKGVAYTTGYRYDGAGRLTGLTYPDGRQIDYTLDGAGRISRISATPQGGNAQTVVDNVAYRPFGPVQGYTYGNGQTASRQYDQDGRISAYSLGTLSQVISYDAAGRITALTDPTAVRSYGYDPLDRLTDATTPAGAENFSYDPVGNRLSWTQGGQATNYTYGSTSHQLQSATGARAKIYAYDANGSLTTDSASQYSYDVRGRLIQAITPQGAVRYGINALGQRVLKEGAETTVYHYDLQGKLIAESDPQGKSKKDYLYLGDLPAAVIAKKSVKPAEILVDNPDAQFTGTWPTDTAPPGYEGTDYRRHNANRGVQP